MNLQPFYELRERLHTASNAGVNLLTEDFRLKRAAEAIQPFSKASPVFAKIVAMTNHLIEPICENRSMVLLDTLALLDAVLTTQGSVGVQGELELLGTEEANQSFFANYRNISSSVLQPLREAMTSTGGGRYNVILETHEIMPEIFEDFRIRTLLIGCLGDSYSEIADLAVSWLSKLGEEILPELKSGFDTVSKREMVHRVHIIADIAGAKENDFYLEKLADSKKEVREALIEALHFEPKNAEYILALIKSERGKTKASAKWASSFMDTPEIRAYWEKELSKQHKGKKQKEDVLTIPSAPMELMDTTQDWEADLLVEEFVHVLKVFVQEGKTVMTPYNVSALVSYFNVIKGKFTETFPEMIERIGEVGQILDSWKEEKGLKIAANGGSFTEAFSLTLADTFSLTLADTIAKISVQKPTQLPKLAACVDKLYEKYGECYLEAKFASALFTQSPEQVFEEFSTYINTTGLLNIVKKKRKKQGLKIIKMISRLFYDETQDSYGYQYECPYSWKGESISDLYYPIPYGLDLRWYKALSDYEGKKSIKGYRYIGTKSYMNFEMVMRPLFRCDTEELRQIYADYYYEKACEESPYYNEAMDLVRQCDPSRVHGILTKQLLKAKGRKNYREYIMRVYPEKLNLTKEEVLAELEETKRQAKKLYGQDSALMVCQIDTWIQKIQAGEDLER